MPIVEWLRLRHGCWEGQLNTDPDQKLPYQVDKVGQALEEVIRLLNSL